MSAGVLLCGIAFVPNGAGAQQRPTAAPRPASQSQTSIRGFGDVGATLFSAADTFDAVLGSPTGIFFGGGVEVVLPQRVFFNVRVSRFQKSGERVFVLDDEVFPLGIDLKASITPVEVTAGYRFQPRGSARSVIPYVGGGVGWHRYSETSDFADADEDVSDTFQGYHVLGGVEFRLGRLFAISGEGQWTTVPDALGSGLSSASEAFGETNLGGLGFRIRFVVGR
jgi:hypothetical protein